MSNKVLQESFMLSNGVMIPNIGFGTWMIDDGKAAEAVRQAVEIGYRHIDTAQGYGNERGVGEGVRTCGIDRRELFVTTKLEADIKDYDGTVAAIEGSLERLGLDYIDLMIIHAPQPWTDFRTAHRYDEGNLAAWCALEKAYKAGRIRAIGVSNFEDADIENILHNGDVRPTVNQVLAHVGNTPFALIDYCRRQGILVEAYSPMGHGEMLSHPVLRKMAERYGVSVSQLCIRYCLQLGLIPLPKASSPKHIQENTAVDFVITAEDMEALKGIERIKNYGEAAIFPVYGGRMESDGTLTARDFYKQ